MKLATDRGREVLVQNKADFGWRSIYVNSDTFHARAALAFGARYIEQHKLMQRRAPDSIL